MKPVPRDLLEFIEMHDSFYVLGHKEPDGDCAASQLALVSILQRLGKTAFPLSSGPFSKPEVVSFERRFLTTPPPERDFERHATIIVDCSALARTGEIGEILPKTAMAFIDHHTGVDLRDAVSWVDERSASVCGMILVLMETLGLVPTQEEAATLFYGLCTDTGFFRHPDETGAEVFEIAARLIRAGASPKKTYAAMYGGKTLASRRMTGEILSRIESLYDGRLLVSTISLEDQEKHGKASRDPDVIYQLMMAVEGCEVAMLIRQENETGCTLGLRSRDRVNVAQVAAGFGGGGHRLASGATIPGRIDEVKQKLVFALAPYLEHTP